MGTEPSRHGTSLEVTLISGATDQVTDFFAEDLGSLTQAYQLEQSSLTEHAFTYVL